MSPLGVAVGLPLNVDKHNTPIYEAGFRFGQCLQSLAMPMNFQSTTIIVAGKRVDHARNEIVDKALHLGAEYIYFADSDTLFPPQAFHQLLWRARNNKHRIVSGVYFSKSNPCWPLIFHEPGRGSYLDWVVGDYLGPMWAIGMGCALIHTSIFEHLDKPYFEVDYGLHMDDETGNMGCSQMTEDLPFCEKCREAGIDIYVDTSIQCQHFDKHSGQVFGLNDSMPQAQHREPRTSPTLYIGTLLAGGEPAHVLAKDPSIKPTWVGGPDKVPTEDTYERVCVKDADVKRAALNEVVKEWARVTKPGGSLEVMHPDFATWIQEGREFQANALYPPTVIEDALREAGQTDVITNTGNGYHFIKSRKPLTDETLVSILVLAHGMEDMTRQCIDSLRQTTHEDFEFEVVLIDNASPVPLDMGDRVVRNEDNLPFGKAMMGALETVKSPYVVLLNNDTVMHKPDWLENLLRRIRGQGQIVGVGPKQITPAGTVYWAGTVFDENRIPYHHALNVAHDHPSVQMENPVLALNFGCALLRTDALRQWPLDPIFDGVGNYEDVDWCLTVRSKGMVLLYTPSSEIVHFGAQTQTTDPERSRKCIEENRQKLLDKWKDAPPGLFGHEEPGADEADGAAPGQEEVQP